MSTSSGHDWASMQAMKRQEEVLAREVLHKRAKLRALRTLLPKAEARAGLSEELVSNYLKNACSIVDKDANSHKRIAFVRSIYTIGPIGYIESAHMFSFTAAKRSLAEDTSQTLHFFPPYLSSIISRLSSIPMGYVRVLYCFSKNHTFRPKVPAPGSVSVGLFSTRSPSRPNQIAMSYAHISGFISPEGLLPVIGLDALHQSPILSVEFFPSQTCQPTISLIDAQLSRSNNRNSGRWFSEKTFKTQGIRLQIQDDALQAFNRIVSSTPGYKHLQPESFIRSKLCAGTKNSRWMPKRGTIGFGKYRIAYSVDFSTDKAHDFSIQNVTVTHIYEFSYTRSATHKA
ncbi:Hypothetical protein GLP15_3995 [Giardia lamblia P15]|uniref:TsaA-like domain-containing protein n=1 Tax=Giardia intestinalis (strain P15) TaxID=658858 RepID=E1F8B8_GIAIA|nr:Hypothetical protein GLP15_3995 [Giardia lamblia P15]